mgnify:CR=1 FL=1
MDGADWKLTLWLILLSPYLLARKVWRKLRGK